MTLAVAPALAADSVDITLDLSGLDISLLLIYFAFVLGIGFALKRAVKTSMDFFLSGRSLPAWITGIAFISANLGAIEILGQAASGAQYGVAIVHYYWLGAIPAMVFLGIVMMPFYYGSKVRSVPEYLLRRFDRKTHLVNAITFVLSSVLIAGVNLYALASVLKSLLGVPLPLAIVVSAAFVLSYILLGGLSSAIYNEVMQFFVICAGLIPLIIVVLKETGGPGGLFDRLTAEKGTDFTNAWAGTGLGGDSPLGDIFGLVLGLGFCLSFGYWTTNFAEVQRAMSAKDENAARLTSIVGAFPKAFIPFLVVIPGMAAVLLVPGLGTENGPSYNNAIPALMAQYLPSGVLGVAVTGLLAAFMAGMAANVSSFNAVFTYDIWQDYIRPGRDDQYYLRVGRYVTVAGVGIGILTAFIASGYSNISNYLQSLFSFFNVPLFCAFIVGMFWKKAGRSAGFWGIAVGTLTSFGIWAAYKLDMLTFRSDLHETLWGSIIGFTAGVVAMIVATRFSPPKTDEELVGLVWGKEVRDPEPFGATGSGGTAVATATAVRSRSMLTSPTVLGTGALALSVVLYIFIAIL